MPTLPPPAAQDLNFVFADHLVLDESPTRDFYRELLRGLAHKNNNLLSVVHGFSSLILMNDVNEEVVQNVRQMRTSAEHSTELGQRILSASGCGRVSLSPLELQDFLPLASNRFRSLCSKRGVPFELLPTPELPAVMADNSKLIEILTELVKNGAEAAQDHENGSVAIEIPPLGTLSPLSSGRVDLVVRSHGTPIPEDKLPSVFNPFFTTKGSQYFGIGLTSVGVIAGQMKMRFGIASQDGSTTAWLAMPIAH